MRGEREKNCFERIKQQAYKKGDIRLLSLWDSAVANCDSNAFPDFVLPNGFIEHFQVTASNEARKGSKHNIAEKDFERDCKTTFEKECKEFLQSPPRKNVKIGTYEMRVTAYDMPTPEYSYERFVYSFKRNFEKHIRHLQDYSGDKTNSIFLIELVGARISIEQNGQFNEFYRLARDYDLLSYVYTFSEHVRYVIFADNDGYELIDTKEIPTILQNIPKGITFGVGRYLSTKLNLFIDL